MKPLPFFLVGAVVGASVVFVLFNIMQPITTNMGIASNLAGPIKYNCELSNGTFKNGTCLCPIEEELGQTQADMYDNTTGFCQTTHGGPGGDALYASVGLPHGDFAHWAGIVSGVCQRSGGEFFNGNCTCLAGKSYNEKTGQCK